MFQYCDNIFYCSPFSQRQQKLSLFATFFVLVLYIDSWLLLCIALRKVITIPTIAFFLLLKAIVKSKQILIAIVFKSEKVRQLYVEREIKERSKDIIPKMMQKSLREINLHGAKEKRPTLLPIYWRNELLDRTMIISLFGVPIIFSPRLYIQHTNVFFKSISNSFQCCHILTQCQNSIKAK